MCDLNAYPIAIGTSQEFALFKYGYKTVNLTGCILQTECNNPWHRFVCCHMIRINWWQVFTIPTSSITNPTPTSSLKSSSFVLHCLHVIAIVFAVPVIVLDGHRSAAGTQTTVRHCRDQCGQICHAKTQPILISTWFTIICDEKTNASHMKKRRKKT